MVSALCYIFICSGDVLRRYFLVFLFYSVILVFDLMYCIRSELFVFTAVIMVDSLRFFV